MFTGIIQAIGRIARSEARGGDCRLVIESTSLGFDDVRVGDSIAVSGVCLTALDVGPTTFAADVSLETLALTTLGRLHAGDAVNLEKALRLSDRLGGHLVAGHVDGLATVVDLHDDARSQRWTFEVPPMLARYIAVKGSVCLDGVSLTVNSVEATRFGVNLIPHTLAMTTLSERRIGEVVNLEVDLMARYAERLFAGDRR